MRLQFTEKGIVMAAMPYIIQQYGLESPVTFDYKFRSEHTGDGPPKFFVEIDFKCTPPPEVLPEAPNVEPLNPLYPMSGELHKKATDDDLKRLMAGTDLLSDLDPGYHGCGPTVAELEKHFDQSVKK